MGLQRRARDSLDRKAEGVVDERLDRWMRRKEPARLAGRVERQAAARTCREMRFGVCALGCAQAAVDIPGETLFDFAAVHGAHPFLCLVRARGVTARGQ